MQPPVPGGPIPGPPPAAGPAPAPMPGPIWPGGAPGQAAGPGYPPAGGAPMGYPQQGAPTGAGLNIGVLARFVAVIGVLLGLSIPFDSSCMWVTSTAWSILAALAAIAALLAGFGMGGNSATARGVGLTATAALVVHWVLIALPTVGSNTGFCLTLGTGAVAAAAWLSWGRTPR